MVVKLVGTVNGDEVIFQRTQGDMWEVSVPASLNGVYVLDMTAYDEAGNTAYWAKYILTIDLTSLCVRLRKHPYQTRILDPAYMVNLCQTGHYGIVMDDLRVELEAVSYSAKVLKGGCLNDAC